MSQERVDLVKSGFDAWNDGDRSFVLEHMSPDVEWIAPADDPEPGTYSGYEGVKQFWDQWQDAVGQLKMNIEELIDADDAVVVVVTRSGIGESSGLEISDRVIQVFSFDGNTCVKVEEFYDRAKALEAAGVAAPNTEPG